ncbi:MAG: hypothetical protein ACYC1M_17390 [Armatimonadota bacterium]
MNNKRSIDINIPLSVIWSWDSPITAEQAVTQLERIAELGIKQVMIEWSPGAVPFWSDRWHSCFEAVLHTAQSIGVQIILRDGNMPEDDTSECLAGRPGVARHLNHKLIVVGRNERLVAPLPKGDLVGARAYGLENGQLNAENSINLDQFVAGNLLDWYCSFDLALITVFCSALDDGNSCDQFIFDDFRLHCLEAKLAEIQRRYQIYMGNTLSGWALTVAACQHSLIWTPLFPAQFEDRTGYNLVDHLALLVLEGAGCETIRRDYHDVAGDLIIENFLEPSRRWIRSCGIRLYGGLSWEENGDTLDSLSLNRMRLLRHVDNALVEQMPEQRDLLSMSMASAVADRTESVLRGALSQPVADTLKRIRESLKLGADLVWLDSVESSDTESGLTSLQNIINELQSLDRLDVAADSTGIVHPSKTLAAYSAIYDPLKGLRENPAMVADGERARRMNIQMEQMCEMMNQNGVNAKILDTPLLCGLQACEGGYLQARLGGIRYRSIILPGVLVISLAELLLLEEFVSKGGLLIAWGSLPTHSADTDERQRLMSCCQRLFGCDTNPKEACSHPHGLGRSNFIPFEAGSEKACIQNMISMVS